MAKSFSLLSHLLFDILLAFSLRRQRIHVFVYFQVISKTRFSCDLTETKPCGIRSKPWWSKCRPTSPTETWIEIQRKEEEEGWLVDWIFFVFKHFIGDQVLCAVLKCIRVSCTDRCEIRNRSSAAVQLKGVMLISVSLLAPFESIQKDHLYFILLGVDL